MKRESKKDEKKDRNVNVYGHVDPELVKEFEVAAVQVYGAKRGFKGKALAKALELYVNHVNKVEMGAK
jgi:hypothetical protein